MSTQEIYEFPEFLTPEECVEYRELARQVTGTAFTDVGAFTNKKWTDATLASSFAARVRDRVPGMLRANTLMMAGVYGPGDRFNIHTDTGLFYDSVREEKSRWTLLVYLNAGFEGGETLFYDTDTWTLTRRVQPEVGKALIFDIDLWHSGAPVLAGEKAWIGCELIGAIL